MIAAVLTAGIMTAGCGTAEKEPEQEAAVPFEFPADASVSYLGPEGTYTEEAARFFFSSTA